MKTKYKYIEDAAANCIWEIYKYLRDAKDGIVKNKVYYVYNDIFTGGYEVYDHKLNEYYVFRVDFGCWDRYMELTGETKARKKDLKELGILIMECINDFGLGF